MRRVFFPILQYTSSSPSVEGIPRQAWGTCWSYYVQLGIDWVHSLGSVNDRSIVGQHLQLMFCPALQAF